MNNIKNHIPAYIPYILVCTAITLAFFLGYKWGFIALFADSYNTVDVEEIQKAWSVSTRFDIRAAIMILVPLLVISISIPNRYFNSQWGEKLNKWYFTIMGAILIVLVMTDAGCFSYTGQRVNSSLMEFAKNPLISLQMLYETYPVWWGLIGIIAGTMIFRRIGILVYNMCRYRHVGKVWTGIIWRMGIVLLCAWGLYGSVTHYPLRWSEAYFSRDRNVQALSLNPMLSLVSSLSNTTSTEVDMAEYEKYLPAVCRHLGTSIDNPFERKVAGCNSTRHNVVVVLLESFGAAPMSTFGSPLPSTPRIDSLIKKSLFFSRSYVPRWSTAYTVYGSVTGIPDVTEGTTASRVPAAIDQRVILDAGEGYKKYYMLGGSANWANIRAIFQSNIDDIKIYEEGSYTTENRVDVWGIDDYDLFQHSSHIFDSLNRKGENFIAYVQTSSNHRPYTVPDAREDYRPLREDEVDMKTITDAGYLGVDQYNAVRYLDFNVDRFIRRSQEEGWGENTLIVFFGDHNMSMNPYTHLSPEYEADLGAYHTPVFIYAPWVEAGEIKAPFTLMDVIPTAFSLAGIPYTNYTMGRDMSDTTYHRGSHAFIMQPYRGVDGLTIVGDRVVYRRDVADDKNPQAFRYVNGKNIENIPASECSYEDSLAVGMYHAARYLYFNNKKE